LKSALAGSFSPSPFARAFAINAQSRTFTFPSPFASPIGTSVVVFVVVVVVETVV